ncbi:MAG: phosphopantetheine adenylyltransferase [Gemmatales bacterium]|nr:MAG: phosphopantetheine adenylyltransferase [Gemmatales bacterium]
MAGDHQQPFAVYTGMFDPVHLGHLDVIRRGSRLFPKLVVGVGTNPEKAPLLPIEQRVALVRETTRDCPNVEVQAFSNLAVQFVRDVGARIMLRGLRTLSDMEYEFTMSLTNLALDPGIETVFLMAKEEYSHVSSTLIKQIASFGGDLSKFVPPPVRDALIARFKKEKAAGS